jgi:putative membrane protein
MNTPEKLLAGLALVTFLAGNAPAQKSHANRLAADNSFVTKAAQGGMAEVKMGQLAVERASNPKVKQFGQRMVDDHSKINDVLKTTAVQKGITVPTALTAKDQATVNHLSKLSGPAFDRAYMQDAVKDHRADVAEFQKQANSGDDPEFKTFASKTVPTLQGHLKMAEDTLATVKK